MPESVLLLGQRRAIVGVLTLPELATESRFDTCVIILNAGIIHRVGPNRLHVLVARAMSKDGFPVVRIDLSGIGDSAPRSDSLDPLDSAIADIRECMDSLQESRKYCRFVLFGLCSGANHAVIAAAEDERVCSIALIDPYVPRTRRYFFNHYLKRIARTSSWMNILRGTHPVWKVLKMRFSGKRSTSPSVVQSPSAADAAKFLEIKYGSVVGRNSRILAIFTGDLEDQHNYREQILDAFPGIGFRGHLELHYFEDVDHTFSSASSRERLIAVLKRWLTQT